MYREKEGNDLDLENKLKKAYDVSSSANEEAYKDIYLLSNQVLSKNPFASKLRFSCQNII